MWEQIAMWGGVAGLFVSIFAVIIIFLTRKNILDILDKDVILFDKNFELKNKAIQKALKMIDDVEKNPSILQNPNFINVAKDCYNELLCVVTDVRVADEFYNITINQTFTPTSAQIAQFKLNCRRDIGLRTKNAKILKGFEKNGNSLNYNSSTPTPTHRVKDEDNI